MALLGYTRISTAGQDDQLQRDALTAAGVQARDIYSDVTSGSKEAKRRPGMQKLMGYSQSGDTIVVWRIDRLARAALCSHKLG
nr:recombinase family protein [Arthrobacter oryzae]